jgi:thymidylate kinase
MARDKKSPRVNLVEVVDAALNDRAIVFGSLPPHGRDVDLLIRQHSRRSVVTALEKRGAIGVNEQWALFTGCRVQSVDIVPASEWRVTPGALAALFEDSLPLEPFNHIRKPAPRHTLLILARRLAFESSSLRDKHRTRIDVALAEDRAGWASARSEAKSWRAIAALECLHRAYQRRRIPDHLVARARSEILGGSRARGWASLVPRPRRGHVIALSGLDGSGKSTQAEHLRETLEKLGMDAVIEWNRITANPSLDVIAAPVKRLFGTKDMGAEDPSPAEHTAHSLRRDNAAVNYVWSGIVALANALAHRRAAARHVRNGRVVICDRYVLDSIVHLRDLYGRDSHFRLHTAIIKGLSPKPAAAYWLDVAPEIALTRKPDEYSLDELALQVKLYEELHESLETTRLDGSASVEKLCERIARDCWPRL